MANSTDLFHRAPILLSVDLEDVLERLPASQKYQSRVELMTERYLAFFEERHVQATFFVVGDVARKRKSLLQRIIAAGHEIGCHTDSHLTLDKHTPETLREDLQRNLDALYAAGASTVQGFRAPCFSLVDKTSWAYDVLEKMDFSYSSSVLPGSNPQFGWPNFGRKARLIGKILEIPITVLPRPLPPLPFAGGMYFRCLPWTVIHTCCRRATSRGETVVSYLHPYDIDSEDERFMFPGIGESRFFNFLLFYNRSTVFPRLAKLLSAYPTMTYRDYTHMETGHA